MTRFLPLVVFVIWISSPQPTPFGGVGPGLSLALFLGFYLLLVLALGDWGRRLARNSHLVSLPQRLRRFNTAIHVARLIVPAWFGVGVFVLGWKMTVDGLLANGSIERFHLDSPGLILGSLPPFLAWMGLWWAQYPADQALREHNLLIQLSQSLPIHPPPSFWQYLGVNLRLQLLFSIAPAIVLIVLRDALSLTLPPILNQIPWLRQRQMWVEAIISVPSVALILVLGPEILRRVLQTETMPDCPLRRRLEKACRQNNIGFRDVLTWRTRHQIGNAAVMGFIPQVRYILLTDLLLETMSDEQIEAVFAHEMGHVKHRHLWWLLMAMAVVLLGFAGPGQWAADWLQAVQNRLWLPEDLQMALIMAGSLGIFALVFGYISRRFERQADVFAARTMELQMPAAPSSPSPGTPGEGWGEGVFLGREIRPSPSPGVPGEGNIHLASVAVIDDLGPNLHWQPKSHVGRRGAEIFCSALQRVASVNNIPIEARSWCHGSIARRMHFLRDLGGDPAKTAHFDQSMSRLYLVLTLGLCLFAGWTMLATS
jgi:STE24 endopeptidase